MADVASTLRGWSATASSNLPAGATIIGSNLDDNLREIQAVIRKYMASAGSNMASGATVDLSTADGFYIQITGTTTITSLGTESAGIQYLLRFAGALTLTYNATTLILPGGANITTAAGDMALMISEGSGNWRCVHYSNANGIGFLQSGTGATSRTVQAKLRESVSVLDFGAVGDGVADDTVAIQAAIDAVGAGGTVFFPKGIYGISASINLRTQRNLRGAGSTGSIIRALSSWAPSVPTIAASTYSPVLSFAPMIYNGSAIDWFSIKGLNIDGNNEDCYGLYLCENYHGTIEDVFVFQTNKRPYTNIRGQSVIHTTFTAYECADGVLTYDTTGITWNNCGFERLNADWYYDQRQPNSYSKGGVALNNCWFESAIGFVPVEGFLRMSGRRNVASIHAGLAVTATTERILELNDTTSSLSADGITMGANPCVGGMFMLNNSTGAMLLKANTGASHNVIDGFFTAAKVDDDGVGNTWDVSGSLATPVQNVTGRFQVRYGDAGSGIPIGATSFVLDADYNAGAPIIRMLGSVNNTFDLNSGKLRLTSALAQEYVATSGGFSWTGASYTMAGASGATGYTKPLYLGSHALWVDSTGDLRIKSSAPASDTDGTVVGTQT